MANRTLPSPKEPTTLLPYLIATFAGAKRTRVKDTLRSGEVHVNGKSVTRHDHALAPGDKIEIRDEPPELKSRLPFPILFEDAHLIAIHKPAGLLSIGTEVEKTRTAWSIVNNAMEVTRERVWIVHRLDKHTSGVLLFAKSEKIKTEVMENWAVVEKVYHALVENGPPDPPNGTLMHHLFEDNCLVVHANAKPRPGSQEARMNYETLVPGPTYSLVRIELLTGRRNQIRAQLRAIGHSIAGDEKYGGKTDPCKRLCLHATVLAFPHPVTGDKIVIKAPMPKEIQRLAGS